MALKLCRAVSLFAPKIGPGAQGDFWMHFGCFLVPFWHRLDSILVGFGSILVPFGSIWFLLAAFLYLFASLAPCCYAFRYVSVTLFNF